MDDTGAMDDYLDSPMEEDVFPCKGCGEVCALHPISCYMSWTRPVVAVIQCLQTPQSN